MKRNRTTRTNYLIMSQDNKTGEIRLFKNMRGLSSALNIPYNTVRYNLGKHDRYDHKRVTITWQLVE